MHSKYTALGGDEDHEVEYMGWIIRSSYDAFSKSNSIHLRQSVCHSTCVHIREACVTINFGMQMHSESVHTSPVLFPSEFVSY